jgi:hypothetical protein
VSSWRADGSAVPVQAKTRPEGSARRPLASVVQRVEKILTARIVRVCPAPLDVRHGGFI